MIRPRRCTRRSVTGVTRPSSCQLRLRSSAMSPTTATPTARMRVAASMKVQMLGSRGTGPRGRPLHRSIEFVHELHVASSWSSRTTSRSRSRFLVTVAV
jgi:hypothetical protein